ncbi:MAG TPA: hypothetical protein VES69_09315, partial [Pyrinomonadaceae bacterium]|nr:hypothetical protein [Pyrinomonadaceae bacterium]
NAPVKRLRNATKYVVSSGERRKRSRYMSYVPTGAGVASELFVRDLITGTIRRLSTKAERDSGTYRCFKFLTCAGA